MSRKQIDEQFVAQCRRRRKDGVSARTIAKEIGVSHQTVNRALATPLASKRTPSKPAARKPASSSRATPTPNHEDVVSMLGQLANGLADEAKKAKEKGDAGAFSSLASKAQSALTALAKHSAPKDEEHEGQYVTNDAIAKYAEAARTKILDRVERAAREASP